MTSPRLPSLKWPTMCLDVEVCQRLSDGNNPVTTDWPGHNKHKNPDKQYNTEGLTSRDKVHTTQNEEISVIYWEFIAHPSWPDLSTE